MASQQDIVVKGGMVFHAEEKRFEACDILISRGRIAEIGKALPVAGADQVIDANGLLVVPGLIDFHTHYYWGATPLGVNPDKIGPATGVTTWLDFGSAGAGNIEGLVYHIVRQSKLRLFAVLNLSFVGLTPIGKTVARYGELFDERLLDPRAVIDAFDRYGDVLRGIKVRLGPLTSGPNGSRALGIARSLCDHLAVPLFVHATAPPPFLEEVLPFLKERDVLTHCLIDDPFNGILLPDKGLRRCVIDARERGVVFDIGHGVSTFSFDVAEATFAQGFPPDVISSDLHAYNVAGPVYDLPTTISKVVSLGLSLEEALYRVTWVPARLLGQEHLIGSFAPGKAADFALLRWGDTPCTFYDSAGTPRKDRELEVKGTYVAGQKVEPVTDDRPEAKWKVGLLAKFKPSGGQR